METKIRSQIFIEYKHTVRECVDTIGFIEFMLKGKRLQDYANLFCRNKYEKNDKTILK